MKERDIPWVRPELEFDMIKVTKSAWAKYKKVVKTMRRTRVSFVTDPPTTVWLAKDFKTRSLR